MTQIDVQLFKHVNQWPGGTIGTRTENLFQITKLYFIAEQN